MKRRLFLVSSACTAACASIGLASGMLVPLRVLAQWPADVFFSTTEPAALAALTGGAGVEESERVEIQARAIAEDGASVPIAIRSHLPGTRAIMVLSEKNPNPAIARFRMGPGLEPYVSLRIKMAGTGRVLALVETDKGFFSAGRKIQVTAGGCG